MYKCGNGYYGYNRRKKLVVVVVVVVTMMTMTFYGSGINFTTF